MRGSRGRGDFGLVRGLRGSRVPAVGFARRRRLPARPERARRGADAPRPRIPGSFGSEGNVTLSNRRASRSTKQRAKSTCSTAATTASCRYGPNHELLQVWGAGVKTEAARSTKSAPKPNAKPGSPGSAKASSTNRLAIAVDNASTSPSNGDVYVVANQHRQEGGARQVHASSGELIDAAARRARKNTKNSKKSRSWASRSAPPARSGSTAKPKKKKSMSSASATASRTLRSAFRRTSNSNRFRGRLGRALPSTAKAAST